MRMSPKFSSIFFILSINVCLASSGLAESGDVLIKYQLGLAARARGEIDAAHDFFKKACMAQNGIVDACLAWAEVAARQDDTKAIKRSLGSAVMLAPEDIRGRTILATRLIAKPDYQWAEEHLVQAVAAASDPQDKALLNYYLAYVFFKTGKYDEADELLASARATLPVELHQRVDYYRGLIANRLGATPLAVSLMGAVNEGPDEKWATAASDVLNSWSAFPHPVGFAAMLSGGIGINTHPSSAFLDAVETDSSPVLQSIFRGDLIYTKDLAPNTLQGILTVYREQSWTELGGNDSDASLAEESVLSDTYTSKDFNTTVFFGQAALMTQSWGDKYEHELKIGADGELQFMDHPPLKDQVLGEYQRSADPFRMISWAAGGKLWWSFAKNRDKINSIRLKIEGRPSFIDRDRSAVRFRLRTYHTAYFADRKIKLKLMVGTRYDRTYEDSTVIKYDRLLPEAEISLRWRMPVPRLTAMISGQLKYNWYLNSRQNQKNSFRPQYVKIDFGGDTSPVLRQTLNEYFEKEYYDMDRRDVEWEVKPELQLALWKGAILALNYTHHQRKSNIDDAPTGTYITSSEDPETEEVAYGYHNLPPPRYSYTRDMVMLEYRQRF